MNPKFQMWAIFIFLYQKPLKLVFEYKIAFWIYVIVMWIHKGYFVVEKLVWNVRIKAFWYTKIFYFALLCFNPIIRCVVHKWMALIFPILLNFKVDPYPKDLYPPGKMWRIRIPESYHPLYWHIYIFIQVESGYLRFDIRKY